ADDRPGVAQNNWTVSQLAFISGDVSSASMSADNPTTESLFRHCVRMTNYTNHFDSVLKISNAKRVGLAPRFTDPVFARDLLATSAGDIDRTVFPTRDVRTTWFSVGRHRPACCYSRIRESSVR